MLNENINMTTEQSQQQQDMNIDQVNDNASEQYLTFILAGEEYGVDILRVQEIKCWDNATKIPNTPGYIKGVINLRGTIVPIVDLRARFDLESIEYNETTVVIVLKVMDLESVERTMGFVVDAVSEVYNLTNDQFKPTPNFGSVVSTVFIKGLATVDEKMVILLNIDHLIDAKEVSSQADNVVTH
jgi:purine-binding chemotaxis protein CheW